MENLICWGPECHREVYVKTTGLCRQHNVQYRKKLELTPLRGAPKVCKHDTCNSQAQSKGYCRAHYMQLWKYGYTYGDGSPEHCSSTNCKRPVSAAGLCQRHFANGVDTWVHGTPGECAVEPCTAVAWGVLCRNHRNRAAQYHLAIRELVELIGDGTCEGCKGKFKDLDIHHDHSCCDISASCGNCVVAALCGSCNKSSGYAKDDPELLRRLADIMERGPKFEAGRVKDPRSPMDRT
jgi:Recombination endonuclease VII